MHDALARLGDPFDPRWHRRARVGLRTGWVALGFLASRPRLWPWAFAPMVGVLALVGAVGVATFAVIAPTLAWWTGADSGWERLLVIGLPLLVALIVSGLLAVALYFVLGIVAAPFFEELSDRVEREVCGATPPLAWGPWLAAIGWSVVHSLGTLLLWIAVAAVTLSLQLLPGIGLLAAPVGFAASGAFLARETMDGPMSRRRWGLRDKFAFVVHHPATVGVWGLTVAAWMWVPVLNLLAMPVAVVGGTLLFCRIDVDQRSGGAAAQR